MSGDVDQDINGKTKMAEMYLKIPIVQYTLAACHPYLLVPHDYSSQHTTHPPWQTEQDTHTTTKELEEIEETDYVSSANLFK